VSSYLTKYIRDGILYVGLIWVSVLRGYTVKVCLTNDPVISTERKGNIIYIAFETSESKRVKL